MMFGYSPDYGWCFWTLAGHETELCDKCGGRVVMVWWCDSKELWERVTGEKNGGGVYCPRCFDVYAGKQGAVLRWKAEVMIEKSTELL